MNRKRPRKDILYVSKRHSNSLCKQEADFISNVILNTTASSRYSENTSAVNSCDQFNNTTDINNDSVHEMNDIDDTCIESQNYDNCKQSNDSRLELQLNSQLDLETDLQSNSQSFVPDSIEKSISYVVSENANLTDTSFNTVLAMWAVQHRISHTALTSLLQILRQHSCFSTLLLHAKSFLKTPRKQEIHTVVPGTYCHFGILHSVLKIITSVKDSIDCVKIFVNVDGLPLTKSSQQQFWPILGSIFPYENVFIIGIYHGNEKPENANDFLKDFVNEAKELCEKGINIDNRNIPCRIEALICDTPAKAFVLCVKGHSGYSSCTKYTTEGEYIDRRMCFPQIDAPRRSDDDFIQKIDDTYHKPNTTCSLLNIPYFKPVTNVPLDYMHLVCLGIMRKLLNLWLHGDLHFRLQYKAVDEISTRLVTQLKSYIPIEFARKPRKLDCIKLWKATEYRLILLYTDPMAFKTILKNNVYINFMTLHVIMSILSSQELHEHLAYAQDLIYFFIKTFSKIYGVGNISHNVHSLVHLVDDVRRFGPVDNFSAFKFENYMQTLKRYIRKADKPLQQVVRRYIENEINSHSSISAVSSNFIATHSSLKSLHYDGPLIPYCNNPQYKIVTYNGITLKAGILADNCCGLDNGAIISIENIAYCTKRNIPVIIGHEFLQKDNLFNIPCPSSLLGIYIIYLRSHLKSWPLKNIVRKYVRLPCDEDRYAVFPLLHTQM
ncbi:PREDICTED: uncharacterized protein LOC105555865 [Vollenhovia emeryi]|uniref:uncharacterized protein LOC105555865 n=1 Tax=Vollenhovia emeryi TaxID=411798 RepID=UPI0005F36E02|nr:PREDICTED: uncharacterized protein LOC105555865 [Vollenhovia emeryi]